MNIKHTLRQLLPSLMLGVWGWVFFLTSCTLSMDDYTIAEEDRGKDEIYTERNEYGSVSYQFREGVLYVTANVQQYLVRVEADSILYFNGNMPDDWKPFPGLKLAASISHILPYGLNHMVLRVEDMGGILKATTTRVATDDIYEHLSYCFDGGVPMPDLSGLTEEELLDYGYQLTVDPVTGDTVITDWNDYDVANGLRPAQAKRRSMKRYQRMTRGDDDIEEGELDNDGISESVWCDQFWDTRDLEGLAQAKGLIGAAWRGMFNIIKQSANAAKKNLSATNWKNLEPYFGFGLKVTDYKKFHIEEDRDKKYELKYTDEWSTWDVRAEAGLSYSPQFKRSQETRATYGNAEDMFEKMKAVQKVGGGAEIKKNTIKASASRSWEHTRVRIPIGFIGSIPVAIVGGANFSPTFEVNGSISVNLTYTTDKLRTIHKVEKGVTTDTTIVLEKGTISKSEICGDVSVKIGAGVRGFVGFEVAGSVGVTVGYNLEAYVEGDAHITILAADIDVDNGAVQYAGLSLNAFLTLQHYWDVQLFVAPLGIEVYNKELVKGDTKVIMKKDLKFGPNIEHVSSKVLFGYERGEGYDDDSGIVTGRYVTGDMNIFKDWLLSSADYYPGMKIYFGPVEDNVWTYMYPMRGQGKETQYGYEALPNMGDWKTIQQNTTYDFVWQGDLKQVAQENKKERIDEVHMIPILYTYKSGYNPAGDSPLEAKPFIQDAEMIVMDGYPTWQNVAEPLIYTTSTGQLSSEDLGMHESGSLIGQGDNTWAMAKHVQRYEFYTTVNVTGGSRMKEWGLDLKIYNPQKKRISGSHRIIKVNKLRSGTYTFIFRFDSDWEGNKSLVDDDGKEIPNQLYFTVKPYWIDPRTSGATTYATDNLSTAKHPIKYDFNDEVMQDLIMERDDLFGEVSTEVLSQVQ